MLGVEDIHSYYGDSYVLQGVTISVPDRSIVALVGRNGVGKTTLIRSIMGFTGPRRGRVMLDGKDITRLPPEEIARMRVGLVPQGRRIFGSLTVEENLRIAERPRDSRGWTVVEVLELFPRLKERLTHRGSKLSGGEQQMLASARALVGNPAVLLMDEPTEGLAPLLVRDMEGVVQRLKEEDLSILLVEQNLPFALKHADYVYVMSKGKIVHESSPAALLGNEDIKSRYLGV